MADTASPRIRLRSLVKGGSAKHPLLFPLVHALASKIEALEIYDFLSNPTKLTKGLLALHQAVLSDGILCCCGAALEAEAVGAQLDWGVYPPRIQTSCSALGLDPDMAHSKVTSHPRVAAALEAARRIKSMAVAGEPAVIAGLTGPSTLCWQLGGHDCEDPIRLYEICSQLLGGLTRDFCQAGASVLFLMEDIPPSKDESVLAAWESAVLPVVRMACFHQALPVLLLPKTPDREMVTLLANRLPASAVLCADPVELPETLAPRRRGLAVDHNLWDSLPPESSPVLLSTKREVPIDSEIGALRVACQRARTALGFASFTGDIRQTEKLWQ